MKYLPFLILFLGLPLAALAQAATSTSTGFVPLTNIPILYETGAGFSLDQFLNNLYQICIGIAAVLAVLQIMRAGIMYMGGDSVTEKKEAKNLIAMSIGGLILVLSPVIVFSIINPEILSLKINNIEELAVEVATTTTATTTVTLPGTEQGMCSITYVQLGRSMDCSAAGPDWEQASLSCCTAALMGGDGFCCGRRPSTPPPDSTTEWSYTIAVREPTYDILAPWCVQYEQGGDSNVTSCALKSIGRTDQLTAANVEHVVTSECNGTKRTLAGSALEDLPTCSP